MFLQQEDPKWSRLFTLMEMAWPHSLTPLVLCLEISHIFFVQRERTGFIYKLVNAVSRARIFDGVGGAIRGRDIGDGREKGHLWFAGTRESEEGDDFQVLECS